jgi:signal transduction histidine kinase
MRWWLAFLVAIVIVIAVLAWQAFAAAMSHRALASRVLHDYADLASTEFVRRSTSFIGNYGFGASVRAMRRAAGDARSDEGALPSREAIAAALPAQSKRAIEFVGTRIRFDTDGRRFETSFQDGYEGVPIGEDVQHALIARAREAVNRQIDYRVLNVVSEGRWRAFVFTADDVGQGRAAARLGYEVRTEALTQWFKEFILPEPLLPLSLATRDAAQSALRIVVRSPDGKVLVRSPSEEARDRNRDSDVAVISHKQLEDRNENSLGDLSVEMTIDPASARRLVIGGLPESRIGVVAWLLMLAIGLAGAAMVQISRERALAQLREDFVTRVSHELRTPVARLRMFAETLLLDRFRNDDERRRSVEAIDRGARRLAYLIENVMYHAAPYGQAVADACDLCPLAREVINDFDAMTDASARPRVELHCASARARVDRESFHQILLNLLDNAAKYAGSAPACIRVEVDGVQLRVIDNGPGIPAADRVRVWQPYMRLDRDRRSSIAGAGIGLAVVHDLVRRAGGRCWIDETPGGGATITVAFAAAREQDA